MRRLAPLASLLLAACAAPLPQHLGEKPPKEPIGEWLSSHYTYPTGQYDPAWWLAARPQDEAISVRMPAGVHRAEKNSAFLDPSRMISLGPKPMQSTSDFYTGRINDIVVSPNPLNPGDPNSHRVFIASDGGGVWRSDNCCSSATEFVPVTDDPAFPSIAIGDLEMDPNDPNVVYAGTGDVRFGSWSFGSVGLLKTSDGGQTWRLLGEEVFVPRLPTPTGSYSQYQAIGKIAVDPNDSNKVVVGTKTGLYLSYDAGENWTGPCYSNPYTPDSGNPHRQDITGLLALDLGATTRIVAAVGTRGNATPVQPDLDFNGANGIYAAAMPAQGCPVGWQLLSRPDNGWPVGTGAGNAFGPLGRLEIAAAPSDPNRIYAKAIDPQSFAILGLWRSVDGGQSWQARATPANFSGCEPGTQNWYNAGITVAPNNPEAVILSAWWVYRSNDGAGSFEALACSNNGSSASMHIDQHARAFVGGDPRRLLVGNDGGVYYSANATDPVPSFQNLNSSLSAHEFYYGDIGANFANSDPRTIVGGAQDNGTSLLMQSFGARADTWLQVWGGDGIVPRIEPILGQRHYYSTQRGRIVLSTNGPSAPEVEASGPWNPGQTGPERKSFLMPFDLYKFGDVNQSGSGCTATEGCTHLIAGTFRVWESTNGAVGNTQAARWTAISPDLTKNNLIVGTDNRSVIQAIRFSIPDRRVAMVGTLDGNIWYGFGLGTGAPTWRDVTGGNQVLPNRSILGVATDPVDPLIGYAAVAGFGANTPGTPGHVYQVRCTADCASFTWRDVSGNLPDVPANAVMVNPHIRQQVFVGTDWGLYYTDNVEAAEPIWHRFPGLPRAMVWDMAIDRGFTTLAVFTRSRGAFVWPLPTSLGQPNLTGLWSAPGEDGWGLSLAHQGQILFPAWYTYEADGRPGWLVISGATRQGDGSYLGPVFRFTGLPFAQVNGTPAAQGSSEIGSARFTPQADGTLRFDYTVDGVAQGKTVRRVAPGPIPSCRFTEEARGNARNVSDIWWNPAENGWGLHLIESNGLIFLAWYTYGADGKAMWVSGLLSRQPDGRFLGALNRPSSGVPFAQINGPATSFPVPEVGQASLRFSNGEQGVFEYTLDGVTQSKTIERFLYAGPERSVCEG